MELTRRRLFAALAAGSSLTVVARTDGFSQVGVGHATAVDTTDDEGYLSIGGEALSEPVAESSAELTITSRLEDVTVTALDTDTFAFDPAPPLSLAQPVTVDVSLTGSRTGVVTDTVTVVLEGSDVRAAVERDLHVEVESDPGDDGPESDTEE